VPKTLSQDASAVYAAIIAKQGMTSRVRSLSTDIADACDSAEALDWSEDLASLGFSFEGLSEKDRDDMQKSLAVAFGTVATESAGSKKSARVTIIESGDTVEVAVAFRNVKPREKK